MSPHNNGSTTRNSSRGRKKNKEPLTATPSSNAYSSPAPPLQSPSHTEGPPLDKQNKLSPDNVSTPLPPVESQDSPKTDKGRVIDNSESGDLTILDNKCSGSRTKKNTRATTAEVSDNRELSLAAATSLASPLPPNSALPSPLQNVEDFLNPSPDDPWHVTYAELKNMRARLLTLDKVEAATIDLDRQSKAADTDIKQNSSRIRDVGQDVKKLRKDLEKQHKQNQQHFKDLKEMGKDLAQVKGMGQDLISLRKDLDKQLKTTHHQAKETKDMGKEVAKVAIDVDKQHKLAHDNAGDLQKLKDEIATLQVTVTEQKNTIQSLQESEDIQKLKDEISSLQQTVAKQKDTMSALHKIKDDFARTSHKTVKEMNELVNAQRTQVEEFKTIRKNVQQDLHKHQDQIDGLETFKTEIQQDTQKQIKHASEEHAFQALKKEAFYNRYNLVITGMPEQEERTAYSVIMKFFKTDLKLKKLEVLESYRMGQAPLEGSTYSRPIMVIFAKTGHRNLVWKRRNHIPPMEGGFRVKIQADLPKQLRDDVTILYKVLKAATAMAEYRNASIRDYALNLNGKIFTARQPEQLPLPLRPSSLSVRVSEEVLAFFTRYSILSNHFPATFQLQDKTFHTVEQYLAFRRAQISQQDHLVEKALHATDPIEAKSILNALRKENVQEWQEGRADIAIKGLRAKFTQNQQLLNYLRSTHGLTLGEASKNPVWGVGMTLEDEHLLDTTKWSESGNLLGSLLMQLRTELAAPVQHST